MATTIGDLRKGIATLHVPHLAGPVCPVCDLEIVGEHDGESFVIDGKPAHCDCYFSQMGDAVEEYPIGTPRIRRR